MVATDGNRTGIVKWLPHGGLLFPASLSQKESSDSLVGPVNGRKSNENF